MNASNASNATQPAIDVRHVVFDTNFADRRSYPDSLAA